MADDHSQRPYRSNEAPARGVPMRAPPPAAGGDPLAELARLIGQNDPFSDRDGARRPAVPDGAAKSDGITIGQASAASLIAFRQGDGLGANIGFTMPAPAIGGTCGPSTASDLVESNRSRLPP